MAGVHIRALTAVHRIKPTSTRCRSARQPNPGRGSTYRRGDSVQTIGTSSFLSAGFERLGASEGRITVLPQAIIESAMFFQEDGALKDIRISLKDRNTQNRVVGHPELIRQVLMNIFDNCIKYGAPGQEVEVNQWIQKS